MVYFSIVIFVEFYSDSVTRQLAVWSNLDYPDLWRIMGFIVQIIQSLENGRYEYKCW